MSGYFERSDERFVESLFDEARLARAVSDESARRTRSLVLGVFFGSVFALQPWLDPGRDALFAAVVLLGLLSCTAGHLHATHNRRLMRFAKRLGEDRRAAA